MKYKRITTFIAACLLSSAALADDDCKDPLTGWQPKEQLRQKMVDKGWDIKRIKVDDGCYEVKGRDRNGHRVEAKFSPASLELIELEIKFEGAGGADYLDLGGSGSNGKGLKNKASDNGAAKSKPRVSIE
mgnify:CR=1 FL=1|tara:strand:+ start:1221 stop:1610 length:390 start_codon:yes stop_codon:yes gene_type:complete